MSECVQEILRGGKTVDICCAKILILNGSLRFQLMESFGLMIAYRQNGYGISSSVPLESQMVMMTS